MLCPRVCKVWPSQVPSFGEKRKPMVLLLSIWVCLLLGRTWLDIRRKRCYSGRRPSYPVVRPLSRSPARWVGGGRWRLSRRSRFPKCCSMPFAWGFLVRRKPCSFYKNVGNLVCLLLDILVAKREPTPGHDDVQGGGLALGPFRNALSCGTLCGRNGPL